MRGCEEEGLYRVPGSAQQVRYYERKFDTGKKAMWVSESGTDVIQIEILISSAILT
jgi:hypothetical protein